MIKRVTLGTLTICVGLDVIVFDNTIVRRPAFRAEYGNSVALFLFRLADEVHALPAILS